MSRVEAVKAVKSLINLLEPKRERIRGLLGDPAGAVVAVSGRDNYVYFREGGNSSKLRQILNTKVPNWADLPVVTGEDSNNPGIEQVLDIDFGALPKWLGRSFVAQHHETHEFGSMDSAGNRVDNDIVFVQKMQFTPMSCRPQTSYDMTVWVDPDFYAYGDERKYWPGGNSKTFSPPADPTRAAYELICVDGATNTLQYVRGIDFPLAAPVDYTLIPDTPIGMQPVAVIFLPHGTTSLTYDNIIDVRVFNRTLGGSVQGSPHRHTAETDGGLLSSGLIVTGDQGWYDNDVNLRGRFYSSLGELHLLGGVMVTGDIIVTGGQVDLYDTDLSIHDKQPVRFFDDIYHVGWCAPTLTGDRVYDMPAQDGGAGDVLVTDGAGGTSWANLGGVLPAVAGAGYALVSTGVDTWNDDQTPTWTGAHTFPNNGLHLLDTGGDHDLVISPGEDLSADRILTLTMGDAARTITLSGNPTLDDWFDQSVKQAASPTFADVFVTDGGTFGIAGNELLTVNAAGNFTFSGVTSIVVPDGAWVGADAACSWVYDSTNGDVTTLDDVGIGTAEPGTPLRVAIPFAKTDMTARGAIFIGSNETLANNPAGLYITIEGAAAQADRSVLIQTQERTVGNAGNLCFQPYSGNVGFGTLTPGSITEWNMATLDLEFVDAGRAGASEQDWIEVMVNDQTGYIRVYAAK